MGFLDSLKEKALEASEAVKEKTTSATEAIVDTALKIKCATNWHAGEFNNEEGKPKCFFSKVCPDCGKYITKTKHFFNEPPVIEDPNRCYGYRVCELCGFKQSDYFHNYERADKNEQCVIIERCSLSGHERFGKPEHEWIHNREGDAFFKICRDCHIKIRVYE
ncbi:TPA: hypothetical protein R5X15_001094 [Campylobacter coli]|nr:hypothetical protein [Campylobacter coli]HED6150960.1 hypothetical protein [Campylobacter coli]HED6173309.1 hypothetical protein [Campylobacter coli]HED6185744.1 hypothetical protein [Campylobacter coli]HED6207918.1 hypothetical protein [Campylobacter coli]